MPAARLVCLSALLAALPAIARADKADDAKAHVANATRAHDEGRFQDARVELEAAYALDPRPDLLYALGQVHAKLGDCREATGYFRRFVATQQDARVTRVVEQAIASCKPAEPTARTRPGASTDGTPAAPSQPFAAARGASPPVAPRASRWYDDKLGDGLALGGIVVAIVGLVEYRSALSDLDTAEDRASTPTLADYDEQIDRAHGKRTTSIVLLGAGAALMTAGVVRFVLHDGDAEVRGVGLAPARGGGVVTFSGRF
jgi:tetratricopeptide (TPR) repeat protein